MNIENMTDEQKSVMLAELCGWKYTYDGITHSWYSSNDALDPSGFSYHEWQRVGTVDFAVIPLNLYDPANMALAWRVLNFAEINGGQLSCGIELAIERDTGASIKDLITLPPAEAQRLWLDKILTLAIEAGMVGETP